MSKTSWMEPPPNAMPTRRPRKTGLPFADFCGTAGTAVGGVVDCASAGRQMTAPRNILRLKESTFQKKEQPQRHAFVTSTWRTDKMQRDTEIRHSAVFRVALNSRRSPSDNQEQELARLTAHISTRRRASVWPVSHIVRESVTLPLSPGSVWLPCPAAAPSGLPTSQWCPVKGRTTSIYYWWVAGMFCWHRAGRRMLAGSSRKWTPTINVAICRARHRDAVPSSRWR